MWRFQESHLIANRPKFRLWTYPIVPESPRGSSARWGKRRLRGAGCLDDPRKHGARLVGPGVELHGWNLDGAQLNYENLEGADLRGASLRKAGLLPVNLQRARDRWLWFSESAYKTARPGMRSVLNETNAHATWQSRQASAPRPTHAAVPAGAKKKRRGNGTMPAIHAFWNRDGENRNSNSAIRESYVNFEV